MLATGCALLWPAPAGAAAMSPWSAPASLAPCAAAGAPDVVFPSDSPSHATGPGAVLWPAGAGCAGGAGARIDVLAPGRAPGPAQPPRSAGGAPLGPAGPLAAATAPGGRVVIAGADPRRADRALVVEGRAGGAFTPIARGAATTPAGALANAYLGDLALLEPQAGRLTLAVQRWFGGPLGARGVLAPSRGAGAVTVAMDYRSDAIAAWTAGGSVWARALPASGRLLAAQRLGPAGSATRIAALLSDDNRAIVMWSTVRDGSTQVYLDQSATGPRFGSPRRIEHAPDPHGLAPPEGSPQLVRLSSESVMCAWTGVADGRWVVHTAPIDQRGLRSVATLAPPAGDLVLDALAPGPRGEAVALLSEPLLEAAGLPVPGRAALLAARGIDAAPGRTLFAAPELVAPPGPVSGAAVGIEPGTDRALAVWRGEAGAIEYSERPGMSAR